MQNVGKRRLPRPIATNQEHGSTELHLKVHKSFVVVNEEPLYHGSSIVLRALLPSGIVAHNRRPDQRIGQTRSKPHSAQSTAPGRRNLRPNAGGRALCHFSRDTSRTQRSNW